MRSKRCLRQASHISTPSRWFESIYLPMSFLPKTCKSSHRSKTLPKLWISRCISPCISKSPLTSPSPVPPPSPFNRVASELPGMFVGGKAMRLVANQKTRPCRCSLDQRCMVSDTGTTRGHSTLMRDHLTCRSHRDVLRLPQGKQELVDCIARLGRIAIRLGERSCGTLMAAARFCLLACLLAATLWKAGYERSFLCPALSQIPVLITAYSETACSRHVSTSVCSNSVSLARALPLPSDALPVPE